MSNRMSAFINILQLSIVHYTSLNITADTYFTVYLCIPYWSGAVSSSFVNRKTTIKLKTESCKIIDIK